MLGSFFSPNFASVPQDYNKESPWWLFGSSSSFSEVWKVCTDIQLDLWMLFRGSPFLLGLPGQAGQGLSGRDCSGSRAVSQGLSSSGICFTVNGLLSEWSVLQGVHQWMHLWQQQAESTKSRCELTENIALKNTSIFWKKCFCNFPDWSPFQQGEVFILLGCICNLSIISIFLLISYCKLGQ